MHQNVDKKYMSHRIMTPSLTKQDDISLSKTFAEMFYQLPYCDHTSIRGN